MTIPQTSDQLPRIWARIFYRSGWLRRRGLEFIRCFSGTFGRHPNMRSRLMNALSNSVISTADSQNSLPEELQPLLIELFDRADDACSKKLVSMWLEQRPTLVMSFLADVSENFLGEMPLPLLERGSSNIIGNLSIRSPRFLLSQIRGPLSYRRECYSLEGEDLIVSKLFADVTDGFFVDIGAHHPVRFSNTYLLYLRGWNGINVDAAPGSMRAFDEIRPRDINLECMVGSTEEISTFYLMSEPALNTQFLHLADERTAQPNRYTITEELRLPSRKLSSILDEHVPPGKHIDVLNVDVEGADLDVLHSNDWNQYRPTCIIVEMLESSKFGLETDPTGKYLEQLNYGLIGRCFDTAIFKDTTGP